MAEIKISLKAARVNAEMLQSDAASYLGVTRDTIQRWESGETSPKANKLSKLCELYKIPVENIKL